MQRDPSPASHEDQLPGLARRSVTSVLWNMLVSVAQVVVGVLRSTLLARWLSVGTFGIYTTADSVVLLTVVAAGFGLRGAFLHRAPETENEEDAAAVLFTLSLVLTAAWASLLLAGTLVFAQGPDRLALLVMIGTQAGVQASLAPRSILIRRVVHRRLALLQLLDVVISAGVALYLAWRGAELWALLATNIVTLVLTILLLYVWRPVWRPRLLWLPGTIRYYLGFGGRNFLATLLQQALNQVDDLWTRGFLGKVPLGYYSRAYTFATYPRSVLASSVNSVAGGTYAELKGDKRRLSQAFFRTNALLLRSGFLFAGTLMLVAPEFIHLMIGDKWLPMLNTFRLMLVFTLFDPIKITIAQLFIAVGRPEFVVRARLVQLGVLVAGLFTLGPFLGIDGVAVAVDLMLVVGIAILLLEARKHVSYSLRSLLAVPIGALCLGLLAAWGIAQLPGISGSFWRTGAVKIAVFCGVYGLLLFLFEGRQLIQMLQLLTRQAFAVPRPSDAA